MSTCRVLLAVMPWKSLDSPSLPVGLLRSACRAAGRPVPDTWFGHLEWAEFLLEASAGQIAPDDYNRVADDGIFHSVGDWVFGGALHGDEAFGRDSFLAYLDRSRFDPGRAVEMRGYAARFVDVTAAAILSRDPGVVGFTTTFMQNVPSLAVARRVKERAPHIRIVFGGGNCDGAMGVALHRNYPFVDYVVRGEGEEAFPALLDAIEADAGYASADPGYASADAGYASIPGLCWRSGQDRRVNDEQRRPLPPARIPVPDYADWAGRFEASPVRQYVQPALVLEGARGCWWGEAHQCTFCGLNGSLMEFRSKPADRLLAEIETAVRDYKILDLIMVDNIVDQHYYTQLFPRLGKLDWDIKIQYEIKSNIGPEHVGLLQQGHVVNVQPGIESLSSRVLRLMDKGVRGPHNVRTLRDLESGQLTATWNWLYGFPGEEPGDYEQAISQLPRIVHLQPPTSVTRILLERFSPYFDRPALGFGRRRPAEAYRHVYRLADEELADLVYLFDTDPAGIGGDTEARLRAAIAAWTGQYPGSTLTRTIDAAGVHITDRRLGWPERDIDIEDPVLVRAYRHLEHGRSTRKLLSLLRDEGTPLGEQAALDWIAELDRAGLMWLEGDHCVTLPTCSVPLKVA
jgi:ribosomal peptide maturation radical SAM protein 1